MTHSFPTRRSSDLMTEVGIATIGRLVDSDEKLSSSAGAPVDGVELRIVDDEGNILPTNTPGHIQILANGQHVGFFGNDKLFRSEEHTSELQSLMRNSYAVFCLKKKNKQIHL